MGNPFIPPRKPNNGVRRPRGAVQYYWKKRVEGMRRKSLGPPIGSRGGLDTRSLSAGAGVEERMDALTDSRPIKSVVN